MSTFSQFNKLKLFNEVDKNDLSTVHGYTQYAVAQFIDEGSSTASGTSDVSGILSYDAFLVATPPDEYPLSVDYGSGSKMSARYARHIWDNWDYLYNKCKVQLICNNGDVFDAGPFNTKIDLYMWLNTVVPHEGTMVSSEALLRVYDEVAGDVPILQKMYGVNTLYSILVGSRNMRASRVKTAVDGSDIWLDIFASLTEYYEASGVISGTVSRSDLESDNLSYTGGGIGSNKLFWVGANKRNLYGIPKEGSAIVLNQTVPPDYRKFWDLSAGGSVDQTIGDNGEYTLLSPCYVVYYEADNTWEVKDPTAPVDIKYMYNHGADTPTVIVYLIKHKDDSNKIAFYVKPVGINDVYVDYFDSSKYHLEAVGFNRDRQIRIKRISVSEGEQDLYGDRTRITKPEWVISDNDFKTANVGSVIPKSIKFRLRRLSDNKVGRYSIGTLKPVIRTRGAYIKWLVS